MTGISDADFFDSVLAECIKNTVYGPYKRIAATVRDGRIRVTAPRSVPPFKVYGFLTANQVKIAGWVKGQRERLGKGLDAFGPVYAVGGRVAYRGQVLTLRLTPDAAQTGLAEDAKTLLVKLPAQSSPETIRGEVIAWLQAQFKDLTQKRLSHWVGVTGLKPKVWRPSSAKSRWGCCTKSGNLRLNWRCICLPEAAYDYVIVHELCHLKHFNHSDSFWALVRRYCPDMDAHRALLARIGLTWIY